jgi:hypothetical protein
MERGGSATKAREGYSHGHDVMITCSSSRLCYRISSSWLSLDSLMFVTLNFLTSSSRELSSFCVSMATPFKSALLSLPSYTAYLTPTQIHRCPSVLKA